MSQELAKRVGVEMREAIGAGFLSRIEEFSEAVGGLNMKKLQTRVLREVSLHFLNGYLAYSRLDLARE